MLGYITRKKGKSECSFAETNCIDLAGDFSAVESSHFLNFHAL